MKATIKKLFMAKNSIDLKGIEVKAQGLDALNKAMDTRMKPTVSSPPKRPPQDPIESETAEPSCQALYDIRETIAANEVQNFNIISQQQHLVALAVEQKILETGMGKATNMRAMGEIVADVKEAKNGKKHAKRCTSKRTPRRGDSFTIGVPSSVQPKLLAMAQRVCCYL